MATLTKLITYINLEMSGDTKRYLVSAKQGDKATRFIIAKLLNNGEPYTIPTGSRVVINITKPDGKHVYNTCTYSGSDVTVELTNQALAASGTAYCDIEIRTSDDSQIITSASFTMEIEKSQRQKNRSSRIKRILTTRFKIPCLHPQRKSLRVYRTISTVLRRYIRACILIVTAKHHICEP